MKTQIQKLSSSKLFYNVWPYKVECHIAGGNRIIRNDIKTVEEWCQGAKGLYITANESRSINKQELLKFCKAVGQYLGRKDLRIRVEGRHFNLFCKDPVLLEDIDNNLFPWIAKITGPTTKEELDFLMSNGHKKRLCDALPKGKYAYKVFFKTKFPEERRKSFANWSLNYEDKIEINGQSKQWVIGEKKYIQDPFMYIEDEKTLSIVGMFLSGYVKKVEHFIPRDSVLTA